MTRSIATVPDLKFLNEIERRTESGRRYPRISRDELGKMVPPGALKKFDDAITSGIVLEVIKRPSRHGGWCLAIRRQRVRKNGKIYWEYCSFDGRTNRAVERESELYWASLRRNNVKI